MASAGFSHILRAMRHRNFAIYAWGNLLNHLGTWMLRVTAGWLTWEMTHSATWLGLIGLAELVPIILIGPLAGAWADRWDRMRTVRLSNVLIVVSALAIYGLMHIDQLTVERLFLLLLFQGVCLSIDQPSRLSTLPSLIGGPQDLPAALAINAMCFNGARFIGPSIAGIIIVQWGVAASFAWTTVFFGVFAVALFFIRVPEQERKQSGKRIWTEVLEGMSYTIKHPGIGPIMLTLMITSTLGRPIVSFFPGFASDVFNRGADGLAWLTAMTGAGALLAGLYLAQRPKIEGLTRVFIINIGVIGLGLAAFCAYDNFWLALPIAAVLGGSLMINGISSQTVIQNAVESSVRGRVVSLYGTVQRGGQALGSLILGIVADIFGFRWTIAAAGGICLGFWWWSRRRARTIEASLEG